MKGAAALTGDAVTTTAATTNTLAAVEEEDDSYIEGLEEDDSDHAEDAGAGLDCASVEQVEGTYGTCPPKGCLDPVCGVCTLPRDVWDAEHHEYVRVEEDPFPDISSGKKSLQYNRLYK